MSWVAAYGKHVSQLKTWPDGSTSGGSACAEAAIARYLLECYPRFGEAGEWALVGQVLDPTAAPGVWDLIDRLSIIGRGMPVGEHDPGTDAVGIDRIFSAFAVPTQADYTPGAYATALAAPWALCNVDACALTPAQYPSSWLGSECGQPNHLILWLPNQRKQANWFNDPLAFANGQKDCQYDLVAVKAALAGVWVLPDTGHGEKSAAAPASLRITAACALKRRPDHGPGVLADVPAGTVVQAVSTTGWRYVRMAGGAEGWVLASNVEPAP